MADKKMFSFCNIYILLFLVAFFLIVHRILSGHRQTATFTTTKRFTEIADKCD
jgi:hypothetical protein